MPIEDQAQRPWTSTPLPVPCRRQRNIMALAEINCGHRGGFSCSTRQHWCQRGNEGLQPPGSGPCQINIMRGPAKGIFCKVSLRLHLELLWFLFKTANKDFLIVWEFELQRQELDLTRKNTHKNEWGPKRLWNEASLHWTVDYEMEKPKLNSCTMQRVTREGSLREGYYYLHPEIWEHPQE